MRVERKLAFAGLAGVSVMLSSLAVPALSQAAPLTANVAGPAGNCGSYQCFYYAHDFLNSSPNPQTGQVATVPLAPRVIGPAPGGPSMLVGLDNGPRAFWEVSDGFAQGRSGLVGGVPTGNVLNFGHWQYVDALYYYLHDTVSVPPTQWVNAAHRNGIPVLGTVTGDCDICETQAPKLFTLRNYPSTVKLLYQYAVDYGFDGWVIDMERGFQPAPGVLAAVKQLAGLTLPDGKPLRVAVYLAGESALQPAGLLPYFAAGADWQADYSPSAPPPNFPQQTYQNLQAAGLAARHLDAYWSSYVYSDTYKTSCPQGQRVTPTQLWNGNPGTSQECVDSQQLFRNQRTIQSSPPGSPAYYTSTGLFAPEWTYFGNLPDPQPGDVAVGPASRTLVHAADDALWVGARARYEGPACTRSGPDNAVSSLVTPRSVIGTLPFVTNFNQGEGDLYAIDGKLASAEQWNNLSAQDIAPTWSCTVQGSTSRCVRFLGPAYTTSYAVRQPMFAPPVRPARFVIQPVSATGAQTDPGRPCS